jgi:3-oxoacyl-[acyl-carrier protein] reductase
MDLGLNNRLFIVCGATSGFGQAITRSLVAEQARVIALARSGDRLDRLTTELGPSVETLAIDLVEPGSISRLENLIGDRLPDGVLVNASGPPARPFTETSLDDWDQAYHQLLRWKVDLTQRLLPRFQSKGYGRFVYIESAAIKQPLENLVLSTSLRLAVAGFVKTLSQEIADQGITFNLLAPGYHDTPAIDRIIHKKSTTEGISYDEARKKIVQGIPVKKTGDAGDFSSLALWLLSPRSGFVTGQTFVIDGGLVKSVL